MLWNKYSFIITYFCWNAKILVGEVLLKKLYYVSYTIFSVNFKVRKSKKYHVIVNCYE